jgi:hypothetical protein
MPVDVPVLIATGAVGPIGAGEGVAVGAGGAAGLGSAGDASVASAAGAVPRSAACGSFGSDGAATSPGVGSPSCAATCEAAHASKVAKINKRIVIVSAR